MRYFHTKQRQKLNRRFKYYRLLLVFSIVSMLFFGSIFTQSPSIATAAIPLELPLSTQRAKIVDAKGKSVLLRGVNWFGMETETHSPHGLWKRDYKEMLAQIKELGYNMIRLPFSLSALSSSNASAIDFRIGSNQELYGKTPLEIMDLIVQEAERQGLLILLDCHRLNDKQIGELWYGDGFTEDDWLNAWKMLAERYKNQRNIIGADLKNEPHGQASWGTNDIDTDWRLAAERGGNAILEINPNWLIVVEGVANNVPGQKLKQHWWGGNLEGVGRFPVRLSRRNKLVYSPHEYGPGVAKMKHFEEKSFPKNLRPRWDIGFYYIARRQIAPILIGEFGGRQVDTKSVEGIWLQELVKFIDEKKLSFAYWSWNPNSADTGGVLLDDWYSIDITKQQLLSQLEPVRFSTELAARWTKPELRNQSTSIAGENSINISPTAAISHTPPSPVNNNAITNNVSSSSLQVNTDIYSNWQTGFCVSFKVKNVGDNKINNWQLGFNMNQAAINNSWNANFNKQGATQYKVTPTDWAKVIEPNKLRDFGFCANKLGTDYKPTRLSVSGS